MAKKNVKSAEPKKKKPISLNILEIAKRLQKLEETGSGDPYTLPTASADTKGGVKIGSGLSMTGEVLSADFSELSADDISYGTGTVKDALDERIVGINISMPISGVSVSTAWGALYYTIVSINISSLGLTNAPTILSAAFNNNLTTSIAWTSVRAITNTNIDIALYRPETGTITGTIELIIQSNG